MLLQHWGVDGIAPMFSQDGLIVPSIPLFQHHAFILREDMMTIFAQVL